MGWARETTPQESNPAAWAACVRSSTELILMRGMATAEDAEGAEEEELWPGTHDFLEGRMGGGSTGWGRSIVTNQYIPRWSEALFMRLSLVRTLALLVLVLPASFAAAQCTLDQTDPSVTICQPADGATVASPVHIVAGSHSTSTVTGMQIYLDHPKVYEVKAATIDTNLAMTAGARRATAPGTE